MVISNDMISYRLMCPAGQFAIHNPLLWKSENERKNTTNSIWLMFYLLLLPCLTNDILMFHFQIHTRVYVDEYWKVFVMSLFVKAPRAIPTPVFYMSLWVCIKLCKRRIEKQIDTKQAVPNCNWMVSGCCYCFVTFHREMKNFDRLLRNLS